MRKKHFAPRLFAMLLAFVITVSSMPLDVLAAEPVVKETVVSEENIDETESQAEEEGNSEEFVSEEASQEGAAEETSSETPSVEETESADDGSQESSADEGESVPAETQAQEVESTPVETAPVETTPEETLTEEVNGEEGLNWDEMLSVAYVEGRGTGTETDPFIVYVHGKNDSWSNVKIALIDLGAPSETNKVKNKIAQWTDETPATGWDETYTYQIGTITGGILGWGATEKDIKYFRPVIYYNVDLTFEDIPSGGGVKIGNTTYTTNQEDIQVFATDGASVNVTEVSQYLVETTFAGEEKGTSFTINPSADSVLNIKYIHENQCAKVSLGIADEGTVTINDREINNNGSSINKVGNNIVIKASPAKNHFVSDITVEGESVIQNVSFADRVGTYTLTNTTAKEYKVVVTFAERTIAVKENATVAYNPKLATIAEQLNAVHTSIFNDVIDKEKTVPANITQEKLTFKYSAENDKVDDYINISVIWKTLDFIDSNNIVKSFAADGLGSEEKLQITWAGDNRYPEVSTTVNVTLVDSREAVPVSLNQDALGVVEINTLEEVVSKVKNAISLPDDALDAVIKIEPSINTLPNQGEEAEIDVVIQATEMNNYKDTTITKTIKIKVIAHPSAVVVNHNGNGEVTIKDATGKTAQDGKYLATTITVTATPTTEKSYVESIVVTLNGEKENLATAVSFNDSENRSGVATFELKNSSATVTDNYTVVVTFAERNIPVKKNPQMGYNPKIEVSDDLVNSVENALFEAIIGSDNIYGITKDNVDIKFYISTLLDGYYALDSGVLNSNFSLGFATAMRNDGAATDSERIQITWHGDNRYPSVTQNDIIVKLYDNRQDTGLANSSLAATTYVNVAELENYVKANVTNPNKLNVTLALKEGSALPTNCDETKAVTYVVSYAGDSTYKAGSCEVTVTVTLKAAQCDVIIDSSVTANGSVKVNNTSVTEKITVDGLAQTTVTVSPKSGYAVETLTVKDSSGNIVSGVISYTGEDGLLGSNRAASVTFTTAGDNGAVEYTVTATYVQGVLNVNEGAVIEYCYDQNLVSPAKLQEMVFKAVYNKQSSVPAGLAYNNTNLKIEYNADGYGVQWAEVGEAPTININGINHKFGQNGTEKIRLTYEDSKYGKITSDTVVLTVNDACYNVVIDTKGDSNVDVSTSAVDTESKNGKYKENINYTVTVKPGNSVVIDTVPEEAKYVESITVTDKDGKVVETELAFQEAKEIFGISYKEPTATVSFKTARDQAYTIEVVYNTATLTVTDEDLTFDLYKGGDDYEAEIPTAEELYNAIVKDANPAAWKSYNADNVTVEYSTDKISYKALDTMTDVEDGSSVRIRVTYDAKSLQFQKVAVTKDIKVVDPRVETVITMDEITDAVEFVSDDKLAEALIKAMNIKVMAGEDEVIDAVIKVNVTNTYEEDGQAYVDAVISYTGSASADNTVGNKPGSVTVEKIAVQDIPDNAEVTVDSEHGTVTVDGVNNADGIYTVRGESKHEIKVVPADEWAVEAIELTENASGETKALEVTHKERAASAEFAPAEKLSYTITVVYTENKLIYTEQFEENGKVAFKPGIEIPSAEKIYKEVVKIPKMKENSTLVVEYLAREAGKYTLELSLPDILSSRALIETDENGNIVLELPELWLPVGTEVNTITLTELADMIMNGRISLLDTSALNKLHIETHEFGANGEGSVEKLRISYSDDQFVIKNQTVDVVIEDSRIKTSISAADVDGIAYGFNKEELLAALNASVVANGSAVSGDIEIVTDISKLNASDEKQEVVLKYAGNDDYQPCQTTVLVKVDKAKAELSFESQIINWGELYNFKLTKNPADVQTVDFMVGVDLVDGASGYVQIVLPGKLGELFSGDMNLSEFNETLDSLAGLDASWMEGLGFGNETVDMLTEALNKIMGDLDLPDLRIRVNGDLRPDNIGIYVAGAVTADENYETAFTLNYLIVTPDGHKAELDWVVDDENGLVTLNYILSGEYDLGAKVTKVYEGEIEEAAEKLMYIYLGANVGLDENNEIIGDLILKRTAQANEIDKLGAYTQIAYLEDFGNEMYYAVPIVRAFAVIPEGAGLKFENDDDKRLFTYDGQSHEMKAIAYDVNGNMLDADEQAKIQYRYVGYDANDMEIYNSKNAPVNAGAYTVTALYANVEENRMGIAVGAMVIEPADAQIDVKSQSIVHGEDADFNVAVTPEDAKYATVLASLDASGNVTEEGIGALTGSINIDFPERIDAVLQPVLPVVYENGLSVNELIENKELVAENLAAFGLEESVIASVISLIEEMPVTDAGNVTVTFKDYVQPENVGIYLMGAVTCDPNYKFAADFGFLTVTPQTEKAKLSWNNGDVLTFITSAEAKEYDFDATAVPAEATDSIQYLFLDVDEKGSFHISREAYRELGTYAELAYIAEWGNEIFYAVPLVREYAVVPETVKVTLTGENKVTFDGNAHGLNVAVAQFDGTPVNDPENLKITYVGYDANEFAIHYGEEKPVNAGAYKVVAVYANTETDSYGMATSELVITPADAKVNVESKAMLYTDSFDPASLISVEPADCKTINVLTGLNENGSFGSFNIYNTVSVMNIDLPDRIDNKIKAALEKAAEAPFGAEAAAWMKEAYANGVTVNSFRDKAEAVKKILALSEGNEDAVAAINKVLDTVAAHTAEAKITFFDIAEYDEITTGAYMLGAITCDPNYKVDADFGVLVISPNFKVVDLDFNQEIGNPFNLVAINSGFDFGVNGTVVASTEGDEGTALDPALINQLFIGLSLEDGFYASTTAPEGLGGYKQIAYAANYQNHAVYIDLPIARAFSIVRNMTELEFAGETEVVYDGQPHALEVTGAENVTVYYVGIENGIEFYHSTEAPKDAGCYIVTAVYPGNETEGMAVKATSLTINPKPLAIEMNAFKILATEEPVLADCEWNYKEGFAPVEGEVPVVTFTRREGEAVGAYEIFAELVSIFDEAAAAQVNANYVLADAVEGKQIVGTFTIMARELKAEDFWLVDPRGEGEEDDIVLTDELGMEFTGKEVKPEVRSIHDGILEEGVDYVVGYVDNVKPGTATVKIIAKDAPAEEEGIASTCTGTVELTFTITVVDLKYSDSYNKEEENENAIRIYLNDTDVESISSLYIPDQLFTGSAIKPEIEVYHGTTKLVNKKDYTLSYKNNKNVYIIGDEDYTNVKKIPTVTIKGKGNYRGTQTVHFSIVRKDISELRNSVTYTDSYVVSKKNAAVSFKIKYGKITLKNKTDYTIKYYNAADYVADADVQTAESMNAIGKTAGDYKMVVEAKKPGNYTGSIVLDVHVVDPKINMEKAVSKLSIKVTGTTIDPMNEDPEHAKPVITVKDGKKLLTADTDYIVDFDSNNDGTPDYYNAGKYTAEIIGVSEKEVYDENGNATGEYKYTGSKKVSYTVKAPSISKVTVTGIESPRVYDGAEQLQENVKLQLKRKVKIDGVSKNIIEDLEPGVDYTVTYTNNLKKGTAKIKFTGIGDYSGSCTKSFKINAFSLLNFNDEDGVLEDGTTVALSTQDKVVYTKAGAKAAITEFKHNGIDLVAGKDYTVSYKRASKVNADGMFECKITIKGKGNYSGTLTRNYLIEGQDISDDTLMTLVLPNVISSGKKGAFRSMPVLYDSMNKTLSRGKDYKYSYYYTEEDAEAQTNAISSSKAIKYGDVEGNTLYIRMDGVASKGFIGYRVESYQIECIKISSAKIKMLGNFWYTGKEIKLAEGNVLNKAYNKAGLRVDPCMEIYYKAKGQARRDLVLGTDYEIIEGTYRNNVKKGTASVMIRGIGEFTGVRTIKYSIVARPTWLNIFNRVGELFTSEN